MSQETSPVFEFGPFHLNPQERLLLRNGEAVSLPPKTVDLLLALVGNRGHLLEKDELMKRLWPDSFVEEANLSHHVFTLRKALSDGENGGTYIETVPRRGYRFVGDVEEARRDNAPKQRGLEQVRSIAVLPFRSIGPENTEESVGLVMSDAVITRLGSLDQIIVRPTTAIF